MGKAFQVKVDISKLVNLADSLSRIPDGVGDVTLKAVNDTASETLKESKKRMLKTINLSESYLDSKMSLVEGKNSNPKAVITAVGELTPLSRFDAKPVVVPTKQGSARLKGNPTLGTAPGFKQAGVDVEVTRGSPSSGFVPRGFMMPLKAGKVKGGNGLGVFARTKSGDLKHYYGPSPYQMFAVEAGQMLGEVEAWLSGNLESYVKQFIDKQLP